MKNYNINILHTLPALLFFVLVSSCSQDGLEQGIPLPAGKYPLDLTVSVNGMKSRADGKDKWKDGDEIGVRIGSDEEEGRYALKKEGNVDIANSANILHWKTTSPAKVKAWYPYEPQTNVSIANQSVLSDFSSIDYLVASSENQSYKNPVTLTFKHCMAKVRCVLRSANTKVISSDDLSKAAVTFKGSTVVSFAEGELTGSGLGEITSIKSNDTHEALLVPADMVDKELFRVDLNVGGYDKSFSYIPHGDYADLKPGRLYVYTVTLSRDKMVVSGITASWDGDEENVESKATPLNLTVPENFYNPEDDDFYQDGDITISTNATEIDDYESYGMSRSDTGKKFSVEGSTFTITIRVKGDADRNNLMKGFVVKNGVVSVKRERKGDCHVFTYKMITENATLEYGDYMQLGDFLYSNGKWRPDIVGLNVGTGGNDDVGGNDDDEGMGDDDDGEGESGNTDAGFGYGYDDDGEKWECIGVIFKVGPGNGDSPENYERLETIHGYAVALQDASALNEVGDWGLEEREEIEVYPQYTNLYDGYKNTKTILAKVKSLTATTGASYWAFNKADSYNKTVELTDFPSSGWYLPSIGQLSDLYDFAGRRERIVRAGGKDFILSDRGLLPDNDVDPIGAKYWSSTQASENNAWVFIFQGYGSRSNSKVSRRYNPFSRGRVRTVLTF
ncbi:MAG: fimbrillin family protein [Muribaculaceae bacterium]|nr:fimbrillin family protein [Muribaculaceae bacterium]